MEAILSRFSLQGRPLTCERYGQGHINLTYLVTTDSGRRYILQRLSRAAFHDIPALMRNVAAVTGFLSARSTDPRQTLHLIPTRDGENWVRDEAGLACLRLCGGQHLPAGPREPRGPVRERHRLRQLSADAGGFPRRDPP